MINDDKDEAPMLGRRLRVLREKAGLSQRALAKKVGIASATISLMESGKVSPSVGSLKRVLGGIPIGLSDFFAFEPRTEEKVFFSEAELTEISKGKLSIKQIGSSSVGRSLQVLKETYAVKADTGRVMYAHEGEEGGFVLEGRIEITVGDDRKILGPGDAYFFSSRTAHRFRQVGSEPCIIMSACTPPTF